MSSGHYRRLDMYQMTTRLVFSQLRVCHGVGSVPIHYRFRSTMSSTTTFHDLKADLPGDKTYDFDQLKGKVVLVVNVASQW